MRTQEEWQKRERELLDTTTGIWSAPALQNEGLRQWTKPLMPSIILLRLITRKSKMGKIIGIAGVKGSGKSESVLVLQSVGFTEVKMAGALKGMTDFYLQYIGLSAQERFDRIEGHLKEVPDDAFLGKTSREFQQFLGTNFGRKLIHQDIWTNAFVLRAKSIDLVACSDVRFPNELDLIRSMGGKVYRVERETETNEFSLHESEKYIPTLDVDGVIDNNGTLEELREAILKLV